jgi:hypothetical protein
MDDPATARTHYLRALEYDEGAERARNAIGRLERAAGAAAGGEG